MSNSEPDPITPQEALFAFPYAGRMLIHFVRNNEHFVCSHTLSLTEVAEHLLLNIVDTSGNVIHFSDTSTPHAFGLNLAAITEIGTCQFEEGHLLLVGEGNTGRNYMGAELDQNRQPITYIGFNVAPGDETDAVALLLPFETTQIERAWKFVQGTDEFQPNQPQQGTPPRTARQEYN